MTLLGTGAPPPVMNRFGPSILVEAGGKYLLFDAGRGAAQRIFQLGVPLKDTDVLFLTHLHSDHIVGIPDLYLTGWVSGRRTTPFQVYGPAGTKAMMEHLAKAFEFDIQVRQIDDRAPGEGAAVQAHDITEGVAYEHDGVKVSVFEVDHFPVKPAFGYRIDYKGRSVVLSGDTRFSENLIQNARGCDVLIHEVVAPESFRRAGFPPERAKKIIGYHTPPDRAGELFARVKPRLAVFSHIVLPSATDEELLGPARAAYSGPLEVGEDMMVIKVGEKVEVLRPQKAQH